MYNKILDQAFSDIPRADFLPPEVRQHAGIDSALPIGHGQTNSQPSLVRQMLVWLDPQPGDRVLDVGSGSGWTSALLGKLVGPEGKVYAVEKIPELLDFGRDNVERVGIQNVQFYPAGKKFGLPEKAPFDRILVSASTHALPDDLVAQLRPGGVMVIPIGNDILQIKKRPDNSLDIKTYSGFIFVPLIR